jgi:hypothetical protein
MARLSPVLAAQGHPACAAVIRAITKAAGYKWRKARLVLTSNDSRYTEKLAHVRLSLSELGPDEAFFSIDEFGVVGGGFHKRHVGATGEVAGSELA